MHVPPPASKPKKSLSLRERMTLHKPSRPHASVCKPQAQNTGCLPAAPRNNTATTHSPTDHLPCPVLEEPPRSASPRNHSRATLDEMCGWEHSAVASPPCRPGEPGDCTNSAAARSHDGFPGNEGSDTDMTQEDMPTDYAAASLERPDVGTVFQPLHQQPDPPRSKGTQQAGSGLGSIPMGRHADLRQDPMAADPIDGDTADDEARWEQALEAEMQGLADDAGDHMSEGQLCIEAEVVQLDGESADDMLDVLADAAAATPLSRYRNAQTQRDQESQSLCRQDVPSRCGQPVILGSPRLFSEICCKLAFHTP